MRIYDLIAKKRDGGTHSREELETIVNGYVAGDVTDYQMAAWMMAVYLRGMTDEETAELTDVMAHSGVMVDLSPIPGIKVDKHSTGGVGDKTTLVIAPIVAACGVKIAKMSGRGLGHTGGTIDKMESVPGTRTALTQEEFFAQVNRIGLSVIGQSEGIAVADKKMYALRDVTATVSCIPLIASSIMSKKLASGSDAILLDVTTGTGAFMKTVDQSIELAKLMVSIKPFKQRQDILLIFILWGYRIYPPELYRQQQRLDTGSSRQRIQRHSGMVSIKSQKRIRRLLLRSWQGIHRRQRLFSYRYKGVCSRRHCSHSCL